MLRQIIAERDETIEGHKMKLQEANSEINEFKQKLAAPEEKQQNSPFQKPPYKERVPSESRSTIEVTWKIPPGTESPLASTLNNAPPNKLFCVPNRQYFRF